MKHLLVLIVCGILAASSVAAEQHGAKHYEYAIVKWDGADRLYYNLPTTFELVQLKNRKVSIPKDAQEEEFYLAYAANEMAKQGWEPVNLNSRRILFRRAKN